MSERLAVFILVLGVPLSVIDAWLSVQSIAGLMAPANLLGWTATVILGLGLTSFAILTPMFREAFRWGGVSLAVWILVIAGDVGTSCVGAVWYGQLGHSVHEPIDISAIAFDISNFGQTLGYVGFVVIVGTACLMLGEALKILFGARV